ncbi:unnamed protein product [Anisakis simplex]|uniref:Col_cuticle_N domain-containing protein n=1 Tax=Anisakis simplex TaxID=6269 RepID=A0A0M3JHJ5_ANISI|nr:unnamed protein product [Anisakis simplex]
MGSTSTQLLGTAIVCSGLVILMSLGMIAVQFNDINSLYDDIMLDMAEFKVIANDAWRDITAVNHHKTPQSHGDFDALFTRHKRQATGDLCNCAQRSRNCPAGPMGPKGMAGEAGARGLDGLPGAVGKPGRIELKNAPSKDCIMCPHGPPGPMGPAGSAGPAGPAGLVGPEGICGKLGPQGPTGPEGDCGVTGKYAFVSVICA